MAPPHESTARSSWGASSGLPDGPAGGEAGVVWEAAPAAVVTSGAVLGRAGEAEPVAAALALALRVQARAKAAAVVVVGPPLPAQEDAGGGAPAARRLAARLAEHGLEVRVRGRLVWVRLDPSDPRLVPLVRRVTLVAAPAVLAITAPRTADIDEALAEQDLLVLVTADPTGPLAHIAAAGLPVVPMRPLARGPARALAKAGRRSHGAVRHLVQPTTELPR